MDAFFDCIHLGAVPRDDTVGHTLALEGSGQTLKIRGDRMRLALPMFACPFGLLVIIGGLGGNIQPSRTDADVSGEGVREVGCNTARYDGRRSRLVFVEAFAHESSKIGMHAILGVECDHTLNSISLLKFSEPLVKSLEQTFLKMPSDRIIGAYRCDGICGFDLFRQLLIKEVGKLHLVTHQNDSSCGEADGNEKIEGSSTGRLINKD